MCDHVLVEGPPLCLQMAGLASLRFAVALLGTVGAVAADNCGAPEWTVPNPPAGATLLQVQAIIRHGDRTPWSGKSCWPNDDWVWNCSLSSAEIPMYGGYGFLRRVYRKVYRFGEETLAGNCSLGQLTTTGFDQQIINGLVLKSAYVDSGFLGGKINKNEFYIRSDDSSRTLQSAEALMLAMYPPNGSYTEILELHTMDETYDDTTPNSKLCPKYGEYVQEFPTSEIAQQHYNTTTKPLLDKISSAINFTVDQNDLDHFADCLETHKCHGAPWPDGMTEDLYEQIWTEDAWQFYNLFKYPSLQENAQVGIGFLLLDIWQPMNATVGGEPGVPKFLLISGHDMTLIPLLVALQIDQGVWPPYASMMLIELYKTTASSSGYSVRVVYNGKVYNLPFCSGSDLCDYKTFSTYLSTITPSDPARQCLITAGKK